MCREEIAEVVSKGQLVLLKTKNPGTCPGLFKRNRYD